MITVEDGTGVANANSFVTAQELTKYATERGVTLKQTPEVLLIKAMDYIKHNSSRFIGHKVSATQPLPYPRAGVYLHGHAVANNVIPTELKTAQLELAVAADSTDLLSFHGAGGKQGAVIEERVEGAVDVKYANAGYYSRFTHSYVNSLLDPLFGSEVAFGNAFLIRA